MPDYVLLAKKRYDAAESAVKQELAGHIGKSLSDQVARDATGFGDPLVLSSDFPRLLLTFGSVGAFFSPERTLSNRALKLFSAVEWMLLSSGASVGYAVSSWMASSPDWAQ